MSTPVEQQKPPAPPPVDYKAAALEATQNPNGDLGDTDPSNELLVAMLAGSTAQHLKTGVIQAVSQADTLDPRAVVGKFKTQVNQQNGQQPQQPQQRRIDATPLPVRPQVATPGPQTPQLELDLFRNMNMNDVYNILSEMQETLKSIQKTQQEISKFMNEVRNA